MNVGISGQEAQFKRTGAGAGENGAQAVALDFDRDGLILVGQQGHFAGHGEDAGNLTDDAQLVNDCLAGFDTRLTALVNDDATGERVARGIEDVRDLPDRGLALLHFQQSPQALVFLVEMFLSEQQIGRRQLLLAQRFVLVLEIAQAGKIATQVRAGIDRQVGDALQWP